MEQKTKAKSESSSVQNMNGNNRESRKNRENSIRERTPISNPVNRAVKNLAGAITGIIGSLKNKISPSPRTLPVENQDQQPMDLPLESPIASSFEPDGTQNEDNVSISEDVQSFFDCYDDTDFDALKTIHCPRVLVPRSNPIPIPKTRKMANREYRERFLN